MKKHVLKKLTAGLMTVAVLMTAMPVGPAEAANTGTFNVLSINVAGLPEILSSSDPAKNTVLLSPLLNNYDIVSTQEDFAYHSDLISKVKHPYLTQHSGNVPGGDGMNFLSRFELTDVMRVKWKDAYGFIDNGADQMTPKGILYSSVKLADGYYVDVYDIHTDAGDDNGSFAARQSNMNQLAQMIQQNSQGKAVIVIGDTNSRYTRWQDNFETAVLQPCGLTDAWIQHKRGGSVPSDGDPLMDSANRNSGSNEVVDKIWYRSGKNVTINATSYDLLTSFVDGSGNQLSDHYPITATFSYTINSSIKMSELYGGNGGNIFSFLTQMGTGSVKSIAIRADERVDAVSFTYANGVTASAGGTGGTLKTLSLGSGEYIKSIQVSKVKTSSDRISYIKITTSSGKVLEGGKAGTLYTFAALTGYAIAGLHGHSGDEIDALGVIYMKLQ